MGEVHELQEAEDDAEADRKQEIQHPQTDAVQNLEKVDHGLLLKPGEKAPRDRDRAGRRGIRQAWRSRHPRATGTICRR
ncbi:hypothetical protein PDE01_34510 [Paracoccus denitrificans]|nr:hypothetical protein PDE01_34510 [Paracoccus denitrificans]